jgi:signal transduction histidine kinase/CheY-like chemotaxis protein
MISAADNRDVYGGVIRGARDLVAWLPRGRSLPCEAWNRRHRGLLALLWAHVPALLGFGALMGYTGVHALLHVAPLVLLALLGRWPAVPQRLQAVLVSLGLVTAAAIAVHLSGGITEAHFLFFVLLIGLALYEDWLIFLLAIGYVVLHHGLASSVGLGEVYSHGDDGSWRWAAIHGAFVLFAAALCVVSWRASEQARREQQVAEREALESQLREAQKLESLGLLAGGIAHDFNNLLLGVLGNAAILREDLPAGSPLTGLVEQIELAGQRAATLTRQMLAYSGNTRIQAAPVELSELVEEMATLIAPAVSKRARLELRLEREMPLTVVGDAGQLSQVVMNLLTNAAESLPDGAGTVVVSTGLGDAPASAFVEVADTGCGMTAETVSRIFEPFFTTKFTGRGLGLAAVGGIVRSHGGTIEVDSRVGEGSTFRVVLPLADAVADPAPEPDASPLHATGCARILVVDDEPAVLEVARRILEREGHDVVTAASGSEAVQLLRLDARADAALVDMSMPGLNGIETTRALRRIAPSLPVILSSGYATESVKTGLTVGTTFIQKPYSAHDLLALVREVLAAEAAAA